MNAAKTLRIMPREMRMMAERILSLTNLPKGIFLTMPDHVMFSQGLGLGGFAMLEEAFDELRTADPRALAIESEEGAGLVLDCDSQHGWIAAAPVVDLMGELVAAHGSAIVTCVEANHPEELAIVVPLARRAGLDVALNGPATFSATRLDRTGRIADDEPLLWSLLNDGTPIPAELWWRIYEMAKKALAPDTVVSRRHAGPMIVNDDGTVIGRKDNDDETDISFLASDAGTAARAGDAQQ